MEHRQRRRERTGPLPAEQFETAVHDRPDSSGRGARVTSGGRGRRAAGRPPRSPRRHRRKAARWAPIAAGAAAPTMLAGPNGESSDGPRRGVAGDGERAGAGGGGGRGHDLGQGLGQHRRGNAERTAIGSK